MRYIDHELILLYVLKDKDLAGIKRPLRWDEKGWKEEREKKKKIR